MAASSSIYLQRYISSCATASKIWFGILILFLLAGEFASAHMEMAYPYPIRSQYDPQNNWTNIDYSNTSPLDASGANYPCKGYHHDSDLHVVATYIAGQTYNMNLTGSAKHGGGSCQLSLSYDNGNTFVVVKSMVGGCPITTSYSFTIPSTAPSGRALFAWTWFNKIGNREMYMNCAVVNVVGTSTSALSGVQIFKANLATQGNCATIEGIEVVFPKRGPDVIYGGDYAGTVPGSDPSLGTCTYAGEYSDVGLVYPPSTSAAMGTGGRSADVVAPTTTATSATTTFTSAPAVISSAQTTAPTTAASSSSSGETQSVSNSPILPTQLPPPARRHRSRSPLRSRRNTSTTAGATTSAAASPTSSQSASPTGVIEACSVGSIRCEANGESWSLCADNQFIFKGPVAPGTMCLSNEIVRRSDQGVCSESGQILCSSNGNSWSMCSGGVWVNIGLMAAGTSCTRGRIIAA